MSEPLVKYQLDDDGVALLTLNQPASLNAFSTAQSQYFLEVLAKADAESRVIVITGEGRAFSSGSDAASGGGMTGAGTRDIDMGIRLETLFNPMILKVRDLRVPLVTAVNGVAAGMGSSLALAGDIIVAAESAYFLQAFSRIGLVPDAGTAYILAAAAGRVRAMEMMMLGEKLPAQKALEWGLVTRVVPDADLMPTALTFARKLAKGPSSMSLIRKVAWSALETKLEEQLLMERRAQEQAGWTKDFAEGIAAFLEKRPPNFTGAPVEEA